VRRFRHKQKLAAADGWPSVEGVIVDGKVVPIPKTRLFRATISYSYFVEEYRAGEYVREFSSVEEADHFARNLRDRRLQIRYKPTNPDLSVIDQSMLEQMVPTPLRG
jgi:hypothetical protein